MNKNKESLLKLSTALLDKAFTLQNDAVKIPTLNEEEYDAKIEEFLNVVDKVQVGITEKEAGLLGLLVQFAIPPDIDILDQKIMFKIAQAIKFSYLIGKYLLLVKIEKV